MCFGETYGNYGNAMRAAMSAESRFTPYMTAKAEGQAKPAEPAKTSGVPIVPPPKGPAPDNRDYSRYVVCSDGEFRLPIAAAAFERTRVKP